MEQLKQLFIGRIGRLAYFFGTFYYAVSLAIPYLVIALLYLTIISSIDHHPSKALSNVPIYALTAVLYLALILSNLSISARRLNDTDRPTWFCVFSIVPFVNIPLGIYLLLAPGTHGDNTYGPPLEGYGFWDVTKYKLFFKRKS